MSLSPLSIIGIINVSEDVSEDLSEPMADITRAFFICCQEYSATGTPLGGETTTGVRFRKAEKSPLGLSLTPLNDNISIHAIFKDPVIIQNILDDPRIGGLKLVVYVAFSIRIAVSQFSDSPISSHVSLPQSVRAIITSIVADASVP
ncbi:hypothetical protein N7471_013453 [Penicillium samsonianum]|uniref:uncharacterized protein n=1 Tax=Penicillium samsonianum TaxID=1882272 RepID=UPI002549356F|nr:uncharacterized protein N7471_013453 [Penicillium samsonianum]KAJ6118833.1 hypothetical protein N7471_013453 [Penicillium samsonianum]